MPIVELPGPGRPYVLIAPEREAALAEIDPALVIDLYKTHGALLFRGFGADVAAFRGFARGFCPTSVMNESPGRRTLDAGGNIHTVDGGVRAFNLHPELSREPWKPDVAFFGCLSPPRAGGMTTICDGIALAREMPEPVRRGLIDRRLIYYKATWPDMFRFWLGTPSPSEAQLANPPASCPYRFARLDGDIVSLFSRPALHRPMFADDVAFGNFLLFARFNNGRIGFPLLDDWSEVPDPWLHAIRDTGERLAVPVAWQAGDVLMLDNTRFLHGRTAILEPGERVIATFFGYLSFAVPDADEPPLAPWRRADFAPPLPPDHPLRR
ncbi:TauD/TfdA family dioxygenase [Sphingomonas jatrophae]|uniref:Taurine dioxygenase, alpha-ketoglutarate-dependent n=1 Tax=Sphingomonas jatrophae TaxID=1166337 RepID=A0A1I6M749_9SPHN|nr:TauD/TfdA family dioxygenase [Sphingomonas jatrophae]SFS11507.1 Taurine dioxygenase, alpha-ketoglutarate-dependent [Sphingomonas jatrophae]